MQLSAISTHIRLRSPMEALDLGFTFVQHYWQTIYRTWGFIFLLFAALIWFIVPQEDIRLPLLILWWFKPLYDRIILYKLSHLLFSQQLNSAELIRALPKIIFHSGLFSALTWRRFSFMRSFILPVWQLEQLDGTENKKRRKIIAAQFQRHALLLTFCLFIMQIIIWSSLYALAILLDPSNNISEFMTNAILGNLAGEHVYWSKLLTFAFLACTIAILEPFYIAAGFMLYLNRRTQLEAWDLEIALRTLGERLAQQSKPLLNIGIVLLCYGLLLSFTPQTVNADEINAETSIETDANTEFNPEDAKAKQVITDIMKNPDFGQITKVNRWVSKKDKDLEDFGNTLQLSEATLILIAKIIKSSLWIGVAITIVLLIVYRHTIAAFLATIKVSSKDEEAPPNTLFGLDLRPESLPKDIPTTARQYWQQGQYRAALSLLYRAILIQLTQQYALAIKNSHTEGDIIHLSQTVLSQNRWQYLKQLTQIWQQTAYGHYQPASDALETLLSQWQTSEEARA